MCKYCEPNNEGDLDMRYDPELEETHASLSEYDGLGWFLTVAQMGDVAETSVEYCPWCGRELL